jgi:5-carboxymethyl-2-hydroxymuconic-semialdehyde dehydrogenase
VSTALSQPAAAPHGLPGRLDHYIAGAWTASADGATFAVTEPVSNASYARVAAGGPADIDRAVTAAQQAFSAGPWPGMAGRERAAILARIADGIEARSDRIAELETFDSGLPVTQARGQAARAAENFRFFADMIVTLHEDAYRTGDSQLGYVIRKPAGVAGLITPWNTPFMLETWKLAPALAAGCTVVLKPAEWTPLSASLLPEIMVAAGVPAGVFNMVHGIGENAGAALVAHPGVPLISFTGETTTGQAIMRSAAAGLKGLSMELGGKSPCIVFADADLDEAVDSALFGVFSLNGERCTAGSRILAQRPVYDTLVERLARRANQIRVGAPADPDTEIGALVHPEHLDRVLSYVQAGVDEGARLVAGGARRAHLHGGNYLAATVFADVTPRMRIFQEEIFGPVVCVTPFESEDEAIRLANGTRYGLAAYIWTSSLTRAHRVAHAMDAGMIWLNSHNVRDLRTPFGGVKASGLGREGGQHSLDFYTESHIVHVALGDTRVPRFGTEGGEP